MKRDQAAIGLIPGEFLSVPRSRPVTTEVDWAINVVLANNSKSIATEPITNKVFVRDIYASVKFGPDPVEGEDRRSADPV